MKNENKYWPRKGRRTHHLRKHAQKQYVVSTWPLDGCTHVCVCMVLRMVVLPLSVLRRGRRGRGGRHVPVRRRVRGPLPDCRTGY